MPELLEYHRPPPPLTPRQNVCACVNFDISGLHIFLGYHIYLAANFTKFDANNLRTFTAAIVGVATFCRVGAAQPNRRKIKLLLSRANAPEIF